MSIIAKLPWVVCVALVLLVCWLLFKMIDQSVTIDHQTQYADIILKQRNLLVHVVNEAGLNVPESEVREILKKFARDSISPKGSGEIVAKQVSFIFEDGQFVRVDVGDYK